MMAGHKFNGSFGIVLRGDIFPDMSGMPGRIRGQAEGGKKCRT